MTKEDIIAIMVSQLSFYSCMINDSIKEKRYEMALVNLDACKAYMLNLRYIQEQEDLNNASIK